MNLELGVEYNPPFNTCLTTIKNLLPEIKTSEIVGPTRWNGVLYLPEVSIPKTGDLIIWRNEEETTFFYPKHIALIINIDECYMYHLGQDIINNTTVTMVSAIPFFCKNKHVDTKFLRPMSILI